MRIVVAPSGFKESLGADEVADRIEAGVLRVLPDAEILKAPMVDGGEGFTKALVAATDGVLREVEVTGPVGEPVESHYDFLGGEGPKTAVLEMAAAAVPARASPSPGPSSSSTAAGSALRASRARAPTPRSGCPCADRTAVGAPSLPSIRSL